jgi:abortive infection bacteriophage resistance protein
VAEQIAKGLDVPADQNALAIATLTNINYYRFKIYLVPLIDMTTDRYKYGASFKDALDLYRFDEELRSLLFSVIARIEVKLRTRLDQTVTSHLNDPFWYLDDANFSLPNGKLDGRVNSVRSKISASFQQSKAEFAAHYMGKYYNDKNPSYKQLPPFWMAAELATFGDILVLYKILDKKRFAVLSGKNKLDQLAQEFGASNMQELNSWLHLIRDVRNRCAHHSRTWNCNYPQPLMKFTSPATTNTIYNLAMILHRIDQTLKLSVDIKDPLLGLFAKFPMADDLKRTMGFPLSWQTDNFWT